uniref:MEG 2.4 isoform 4 n=1 Tax=Schistosoma mansoni TaxID=6183 RepID=D7PD66_SCHMA|nr:MEG 2.4 isoform 4 [Schistosoma mansoni]
MCLTIFYVIHLLAIFSDSAEWVITCNKTTCCDEVGDSKICCALEKMMSIYTRERLGWLIN